MEFLKLREVLSGKNVDPILFIHSNSKKGFEEARYLERPLIIANKEDSVIFKGADRGYLNYLSKINIGSKNLKFISDNSNSSITDLILSNKIDFGLEFKDYKSSFFADVDKQELISKKLGLDFQFNGELDNIKKFTDKSYFKSLSSEIGVPIVEGIVFNQSSDFSKNKNNFKNILNKELLNNDSLVVRASEGSGRNYEISKDNLEEKINKIFINEEQLKNDLEYGISYLIDPKIDLISSPNITFYIDQLGEIYPITVNDQIIKNLKHVGNNFDFLKDYSESKVYYYGLKYAKEVANSGYVGVMGVDFLKIKNGKLFGCEINLRINGNNYAKSAIDQIEGNLGSKVKFAYSSSLKLPKNITSFNDFENNFSDLIYSGDSISGMIPYNTYRLMFNMINFVLIGDSLDQIEESKYKINKILHN